MKKLSNYFWLLISLLLILHGTSLILDEWQRKSIHEGKIIEVKIDELNCSKGIMTFHFGHTIFEKKIDTRTCALFNKGQAVKLKHSDLYPDKFLFINERSPNRFILGGLEIFISFIGFLTNWPRKPTKSNVFKNFQSLSDN